jgi:ferredoxin
MVIGQPFVDFILQHKPDTSRRLSQAEALELLRYERARGHLHSAWFKDVLLNRFYAICNCCKCCCGGVEVMTKYGTPMMASSGFVAQVDNDLCTVCGNCVDTCPFGALSCNGMAVVNWDRCMGCGVCVGQCDLEAVALVRDERKGTPLDVRLLAGMET